MLDRHDREKARAGGGKARLPGRRGGGRRRRQGLLDPLQTRKLAETQHEHLQDQARIVGAARERVGLDRQRDGAQQVLIGHRPGKRGEPLALDLRQVRFRARGVEQQTPQQRQELFGDMPGILARFRHPRQRRDRRRPVPGGDRRVHAFEQL